MITGIIEIMVESVDLQAKVGVDPSGNVKVYPVRYPQRVGADPNSEPNAPERYFVIYKMPGQPVQGKGCVGELELCNFNVNCCATNYADADEMFRILLGLLNRNNEVITTDAGIKFQGIWHTSDYDSFDDSARRFMRVASFSCHSSYLS
jgi:hypothetical protein